MWLFTSSKTKEVKMDSFALVGAVFKFKYFTSQSVQCDVEVINILYEFISHDKLTFVSHSVLLSRGSNVDV